MHRFYRRDLHTLDIREGMTEVRLTPSRTEFCSAKGIQTSRSACPSCAPMKVPMCGKSESCRQGQHLT